jgi:hypothetical protein
MEASSTCACLLMRHTRTMPSSPPLISLLESDVEASEVTCNKLAS